MMYRLIVRRDGATVRLFTRRGYDWTGRYPAIASAAAKIRAQSFTLDGGAVVCSEDGVAILNASHRHGAVREAILQAFRNVSTTLRQPSIEFKLGCLEFSSVD